MNREEIIHEFKMMGIDPPNEEGLRCWEKQPDGVVRAALNATRAFKSLPTLKEINETLEKINRREPKAPA